MINESNFFENTYAIFISAGQPNREPDFISKSGSAYWYTSKGVYRMSNHWNCRIASCVWQLICPRWDDWGFAVGFCEYTTFKPIFMAEWYEPDIKPFLDKIIIFCHKHYEESWLSDNQETKGYGVLDCVVLDRMVYDDYWEHIKTCCSAP